MVCHIAFEEVRTGAICRQFADCRFTFGLVDSCQYDPCPSFGKGVGNRKADPRGAPGNDRSFPGNVETMGHKKFLSQSGSIRFNQKSRPEVAE